MPPVNDFDSFFLHLPPFDRSDDFDAFWNSGIQELKKIPTEAQLTENKKKSNARFTVHDVSFKSFNRSVITGDLFVPHDIEKPRVIIILSDYNAKNNYRNYILDTSAAYFFMNLRGHDILSVEPGTNPAPGEEKSYPGYMIENILDRDTYYARGIYLDVYRAIDMLRLRNFLDCSAIGIIGKGFGAAAAIFAASMSERVHALVLDTPSFSYLRLSQNHSESDATEEINSFLQKNKSKNKTVKKNLSYYDALNFSDKISCPCLVTVGFKDRFSPPQCVFALFNHLICDKTIEVYPDEGNEAGGEKQFKKSMKWITEIINSQ